MSKKVSQKEAVTKDTNQTIKEMVMEYFTLRMGDIMKDSGSKIKCMALGNFIMRT